jgi:hypothetical protein
MNVWYGVEEPRRGRRTRTTLGGSVRREDKDDARRQRRGGSFCGPTIGFAVVGWSPVEIDACVVIFAKGFGCGGRASFQNECT